MLVPEVNHSRWLFLVLGDGYNRFLVVRYRFVLAFRSIGWHWDRREEFLDLGFYLVHINVTYYDDTLLVWTIPRFVIVAECLIREVVNHFDGTDRQAMSVLATIHSFRESLFVHTHHGTLSGTPFFVNHATFIVYFRFGQCQVVCPIVKNEQARIHNTVTDYRYIVDIINGFFNAGIGIQVFAEAHTDGFQPIDNTLTREVGSTVEAHVFQEVSQAALVVFFEDGTYLLGNVEVRTLFRQFVVTDVICQSVFQFADAYVRVSRDRRHLWLLGQRNDCDA